MEGKKRTGEPASLPKKKQYVLDHASPSKVDSMMPESLETVVKESIWRQCQNYKRQLADALNELEQTRGELDRVLIESIGSRLVEQGKGEDEAQLLARIERQNELLEEYKQKQDELQFKYYGCLKRIDKLEMQNQEPSNVKPSADDRDQELERAVVKHQAELEMAKRDAMAKEGELERLRDENIRLEMEFQRVKDRYAAFPDGFSPYVDYFEETRHQKTENDQIKEQLGRKVEEIEKLYQRLEHENNQWNRKQDELEKQRSQAMELGREQISRLVEEKTQLETRHLVVDQRAKDLDMLRTEQERHIQALKQQNQVLSKDNGLVKERYEQLTRIISGLEAHQVEDVRQQIRELMELIRNDEQVLMQEMDSIAGAFETLQAQNESLLKQIIVKDENYARLHSEKNLCENKWRQAKSQLENLRLETGSTRERFGTLERRERQLKSQIMGMERESAQKQNAMDQLKRRAEASEHEAVSTRKELDGANERLGQLKEEGKERMVLINRLEQEKKQLERECTTSKAVVDSLVKSGKATDLNEELEGYKQLLRCNACNLRPKSMVLTRCMHVFCKECIDKRLETRQRKCPLCAESFGASDARHIFL